MQNGEIKQRVVSLGEALRQRRKVLNLTQHQVALLAECSTLFVVQLEAGKTTARLDKVIAVANVLGFDLGLEPIRVPGLG